MSELRCRWILYEQTAMADSGTGLTLAECSSVGPCYFSCMKYLYDAASVSRLCCLHPGAVSLPLPVLQVDGWSCLCVQKVDQMIDGRMFCFLVRGIYFVLLLTNSGNTAAASRDIHRSGDINAARTGAPKMATCDLMLLVWSLI